MEQTAYPQTPEQAAKLFEALANAQAEIGGAVKDKKNTFFNNSKYADLKSVWEAWQEVGPKNGLCIMQVVRDSGDRQGITLLTTLAHKDGGYVGSESFWPAVKNDPQAYGSALTYARRYTLAAMVGVCPEDDDGNAASKAVQESNYKADVAKFEAAFKKHQENNEKLQVILAEAQKAGLKELVTQIKNQIELNGGKQ